VSCFSFFFFLFLFSFSFFLFLSLSFSLFSLSLSSFFFHFCVLVSSSRSAFAALHGATSYLDRARSQHTTTTGRWLFSELTGKKTGNTPCNVLCCLFLSPISPQRACLVSWRLRGGPFILHLLESCIADEDREPTESGSKRQGRETRQVRQREEEESRTWHP